MVVAPALALDARFTDANGDMVADAPTDPKQQIDPSVLIFAYTPSRTPLSTPRSGTAF
jgi:phosphonate transport system substrate-binding protein